MRLTELEKAILVSLYALTGGSTGKHVDKATLLDKFPIRQRKAVRSYVEELVRKKLIIKQTAAKGKAEEKYRISDRTKKEVANIILTGGVTLRF